MFGRRRLYEKAYVFHVMLRGGAQQTNIGICHDLKAKLKLSKNARRARQIRSPLEFSLAFLKAW